MPNRRRLKAAKKQIRGILAVIYASAMHTVSENVVFRFKDKLYKPDGDGLPTGGALSPFLAACYVQKWMALLKKKCRGSMNKLIQYLVYVDDGWGVWTGNLAELKALTRKANSINPRFQVTLDHTAGRKKRLVILDLEAWIERGRVEHMFYRKGTAKEYCLAATSAHSLRTKAAYIQSECMRIRLLCSKQEYAWVHLEKFRSRLMRGGYPMWFIDKHFGQALNRYLGIVQKVARGERSLYRSRKERLEEKSEDGPRVGPPGDAPTFWIETTTESIAQELQRAASSSGLDIRVREMAGSNLKQKMCRSTINPMAHNKVWGNLYTVFPEDEGSAQWLARDVVYVVKCQHCSEMYTGETSVPLHKRMYNHWYGLRGNQEEESALTQHYFENHKYADGSIMPMKLKLEKVYKTCGYVDRKITESVVQMMTSSSINRRVEGAGTVGNLYL